MLQLEAAAFPVAGCGGGVGSSTESQTNNPPTPQQQRVRPPAIQLRLPPRPTSCCVLSYLCLPFSPIPVHHPSTSLSRQVLRATAKLSTTIFYIPLVTTVVHLFDCHGTWGVVPWKCYTGVHLTTSIIAGVVILAFSAFSFIGASHPAAQRLTARTHTPSLRVSGSRARRNLKPNPCL